MSSIDKPSGVRGAGDSRGSFDQGLEMQAFRDGVRASSADRPSGVDISSLTKSFHFNMAMERFKTEWGVMVMESGDTKTFLGRQIQCLKSEDSSFSKKIIARVSLALVGVPCVLSGLLIAYASVAAHLLLQIPIIGLEALLGKEQCDKLFGWKSSTDAVMFGRNAAFATGAVLGGIPYFALTTLVGIYSCCRQYTPDEMELMQTSAKKAVSTKISTQEVEQGGSKAIFNGTKKERDELVAQIQEMKSWLKANIPEGQNAEWIDSLDSFNKVKLKDMDCAST